MSADDDVLPDYEEVEETTEEVSNEKDTKKGHYVGIHVSNFKDLMLKSELLRSITDCGFEHPSEVQHECIPNALLGMDIICQAKSGMGKTAVFVLASLHLINPIAQTAQVIVLCHTRELAFQIDKEYKRFSKYLPDIKSHVFYGGVSVQTDLDVLSKDVPSIVVGTPGRVYDLAKPTGPRKVVLDLSKIKIFIMDECDRMLAESSMRMTVQNIYKLTPQTKQTMMFSATLDKAIRPVCKMFCLNPMEVFVDNDTKLTLHGLQQYFVRLQESEKNKKLTDLLDALEFNQVVIFVGKVKRAIELNRLLEENNFPSMYITSTMEQAIRIKKFEEFKAFQKRILVTTDLFGRGIDIERVNVVINYDYPEDTDQYLHRVARAGRFGTKGLAISFVSTPEDEEYLVKVQERFAVQVPELPDTIDTATYM